MNLGDILSALGGAQRYADDLKFRKQQQANEDQRLQGYLAMLEANLRDNEAAQSRAAADLVLRQRTFFHEYGGEVPAGPESWKFSLGMGRGVPAVPYPTETKHVEGLRQQEARSMATYRDILGKTALGGLTGMIDGQQTLPMIQTMGDMLTTKMNPVTGKVESAPAGQFFTPQAYGATPGGIKEQATAQAEATVTAREAILPRLKALVGQEAELGALQTVEQIKTVNKLLDEYQITTEQIEKAAAANKGEEVLRHANTMRELKERIKGEMAIKQTPSVHITKVLGAGGGGERDDFDYWVENPGAYDWTPLGEKWFNWMFPVTGTTDEANEYAYYLKHLKRMKSEGVAKTDLELLRAIARRASGLDIYSEGD